MRHTLVRAMCEYNVCIDHCDVMLSFLTVFFGHLAILFNRLSQHKADNY